jgi:hypothetical protein
MMNISQLREFDRVLDPHVARFLRGPSGIAKSSVVELIAKDRGMKVITINFAEMEPGDVCGLPCVKQKKLADGTEITVTEFAAPVWWGDLENAVLFLDEVDRAREDMQPIAMQLSLQRQCAGRKLPNDTIVFAAGNGEKYTVVPLDQAEVNRFVMIDFTPTVEEWISWASKTEESGVHPALIQFIQENHKLLDTPEADIGKHNYQVPTRRSWTRFGQLLNHPDIKDKLKQMDMTLRLYGEPFVGQVAAGAFHTWVSKNYNPLTTEDILAGKITDPSNQFPIAQLMSTLDVVMPVINDPKTSEEHRRNALIFYNRCGAEAFMAAFERLEQTYARTIAETPELRTTIDRIIAETDAAMAEADKQKKGGKNGVKTP